MGRRKGYSKSKSMLGEGRVRTVLTPCAWAFPKGGLDQDVVRWSGVPGPGCSGGV